MSRGALVWLVVLLLVALIAVDVVQLVWVARRSNPVPTPPRGGWTQARADSLSVGDVARSYHLGPGAGVVVDVRAASDSTVAVSLKDGRSRVLDAATVVRRWRPPT